MAPHLLALSEQDAVELLAYLIASGRGLVNEPQDYGPMRFVEATKRLTTLLLPQASGRLKPSLTKLLADIESWESERRRDPAGYIGFIDECCRTVARILMQLDAEDGGRDE